MTKGRFARRWTAKMPCCCCMRSMTRRLSRHCNPIGFPSWRASRLVQPSECVVCIASCVPAHACLLLTRRRVAANVLTPSCLRGTEHPGASDRHEGRPCGRDPPSPGSRTVLGAHPAASHEVPGAFTSSTLLAASFGQAAYIASMWRLGVCLNVAVPGNGHGMQREEHDSKPSLGVRVCVQDGGVPCSAAV